jgi:hypothetical protein
VVRGRIDSGRCDDHFPISNELGNDGTDGIVAPVAGALCLRDRKPHEFCLRFLGWRNHDPTIPPVFPRCRSRQPGHPDAITFAPISSDDRSQFYLSAGRRGGLSLAGSAVKSPAALGERWDQFWERLGILTTYYADRSAVQSLRRYDFTFSFLLRPPLFPVHRCIAVFLPSNCNCFSMPFASK